MKYIGFQIPDEFVVGYGLDYAEDYRNLNEIRVLNVRRSEGLSLERWAFGLAAAGRALCTAREAVPAVRAVAERFILRQAAAAQRDYAAPAEPEAISFGVCDGEIALNPNRSVVDDGHFRWHAL